MEDGWFQYTTPLYSFEYPNRLIQYKESILPWVPSYRDRNNQLWVVINSGTMGYEPLDKLILKRRPRVSSWNIVQAVLGELAIEHPESFTHAYEFRYCKVCNTRKLIKEAIYECAVCGTALPKKWNF